MSDDWVSNVILGVLIVLILAATFMAGNAHGRHLCVNWPENEWCQAQLEASR